MKEKKERNTKKEYIERTGPCGIQCGTCFAYADGDIHRLAAELKEKLGDFAPFAERFEKGMNPVFGNYPMFKEMLDFFASYECNGCRKEVCKFFKECKVRPCSEQKNVTFCYECPEFPCTSTGMNENLYQRFVANNKRMKEIGPEAYYEEEKGKPRY